MIKIQPITSPKLIIALAIIIILSIVHNNNNLLLVAKAQEFDTDKSNEQRSPIGANNNNKDSSNNNNTASTDPFTFNLNLTDLYQRVQKSVVVITNTESSGIGLGSGFIYDNKGHIITNQHVVSKQGVVDVTFPDGTVYRAQVVGTDQFSDLAVLYVAEVPRNKLFALHLADSSKLRVGEQVAAIGNPFGEFAGSFTSGIISGLSRRSPIAQSSSGAVLSNPDLIQIDAAINPGNSGGPLLNMKGEVIGVNELLVNPEAGRFFVGIGLAIPSNTVKKVVPSLITRGSFEHPWLGVTGTDMTAGIAKLLRLKEPRGFLVVGVSPGSPAEVAGIRGGYTTRNIEGQPLSLGGDVIVQIDNQTVRNINDLLVYLLREKNVGDTAALTIIRNGQFMTFDVILGALPVSRGS